MITHTATWQNTMRHKISRHNYHMEYCLLTCYRIFIQPVAGPVATLRKSTAVHIKGSQCYDKQPHAGPAARLSYVTPHPPRRVFVVHRGCSAHYNGYNRNLVLP